jgi:hypothetical protein
LKHNISFFNVSDLCNNLNAETRLKCLYIGDRKDLENMTINSLLYHANPSLEIYGYPEPAGAVK